MKWKVFSAILAALLLWSSSFAGIRAGLLGGYSPGHLVLLRFLFASCVFAVLAGLGKVRLAHPLDMAKLAFLGLIGVFMYQITLAFGEQVVPAGTAGLIQGTVPTFTAIIAVFALRERLSALGWLGIAIGLLGISLITFQSGQPQGFTIGAVLILLSTLFASAFFVWQKPLLSRYSAIELMAYCTWFGTIPMLFFLPGLVPAVYHATAAATGAVLYIGVFPAVVAYVCWSFALSRAKASIVSSSLYLNPVLSIAFAWLWIGEIPSLMAVIGGATALFGVVMVSLWGSSCGVRTGSTVETFGSQV